VTLVLFAVLARLDQKMNHEGGHGIVAFELAGSEGKAADIRSDWGREGRDAARASLWIDYLYLVAYGALGALAALAVRDAARRRGWVRTAALGRFAAGAAAGAALFDALEDAGLLLALGGHGGGTGPLLATVCATIKFALIAFVIAYLLAALVLRLRDGPAPA
jgi:hypothetical protein